jgi:hypothetical protein
MRPTADNKVGKARIFRTFMQAPTAEQMPSLNAGTGSALQYDIIAGTPSKDTKGGAGLFNC